MIKEIKCPISGKPMEQVFSATILGKYKINYYYCEESGLLQTEKPYWLKEAYHNAIACADTGLVKRNINNCHLLEPILECLSIANGRFLDVAGGYGLLTRMMRDKGFNCFSRDKYCQNLFASSFEPDTDFKADALFAFEVLEHIEDPLQFLRSIFNQYNCKTVIFSTWTFTGSVPSRDWWYYAFESGQHITFYQPRTLSILAKNLECNYIMINPTLHIYTNIAISRIKQFILINEYLNKRYSNYIRRKRKGLSFTSPDSYHIRNQETTSLTN